MARPTGRSWEPKPTSSGARPIQRASVVVWWGPRKPAVGPRAYVRIQRTGTASRALTDYDTPARSARRPFITTRYRDVAGELKPDMPDRCIFMEAGVECSLKVDHFRPRKTGPCHPVAVARCSVHEVAFTLYPPGHVPYGSRPVLPVGLSGELLSRSLDDTMFEAAADAARGAPGARSTPRGDEGQLLSPPEHWWSTQLRRMARAARVLGVAEEIDENEARADR